MWIWRWQCLKNCCNVCTKWCTRGVSTCPRALPYLWVHLEREGLIKDRPIEIPSQCLSLSLTIQRHFWELCAIVFLPSDQFRTPMDPSNFPPRESIDPQAEREGWIELRSGRVLHYAFISFSFLKTPHHRSIGILDGGEDHRKRGKWN
jgi:hypothetical protein